jgi:hypothetical protein
VLNVEQQFAEVVQMVLVDHALQVAPLAQQHHAQRDRRDPLDQQAREHVDREDRAGPVRASVIIQSKLARENDRAKTTAKAAEKRTMRW